MHPPQVPALLLPGRGHQALGKQLHFRDEAAEAQVMGSPGGMRGVSGPSGFLL